MNLELVQRDPDSRVDSDFKGCVISILTQCELNRIRSGENQRAPGSSEEKVLFPSHFSARTRSFKTQVPGYAVHTRILWNILDCPNDFSGSIQDLKLNRDFFIRLFINVVRDKSSVGRVRPSVHFIPDSVARWFSGIPECGTDGEKMSRVGEFIRGQFLEKRNIIKNPDASAMRSQDEVVIPWMNQDVMH
ncbi:hypothetical protein ES703_86974 [subsurface metagenome]